MNNKLNNYFLIFLAIAPIVAIVTVKFFDIAVSSIWAASAFTLLIFLLITKKDFVFEDYIIVFILFVTYQTFVDIFKVPNYWVVAKKVYLNPFIVPVIVFLVIDNTIITEKTYLWIIKISKALVILSAIVILYQAGVNSNFLVYTKYSDEWYGMADELSRFPSIFSWIDPHFSLGFVFIPTLSIVIGDNLKNDEKFVWVWYVIGFIVSFLSLFRWVMLNMMVLVFMYLLVRKVSFSQIFKLVISTVLILAAAYVILDKSGVNIDGIISKRILQNSNGGGIQENSGYTRVLAFHLFSHLFPLNPIFGHGGYLGSKLTSMLAGRSSQIHVGFLSLLYYWGIIGTFLYLWFLYALLKKLYKISKLTKNWGPFFSWIGFILANTTLVYLGPNQSGLLLSMAVVKYLENNAIIESKQKPLIYSNKVFAVESKF